MGSGENFYLGQVSHLWFRFWLGKSPLKIPNFPIFFPSDKKQLHRIWPKSTRVKNGLASYLLQVKSMLGLGQGPINTP